MTQLTHQNAASKYSVRQPDAWWLEIGGIDRREAATLGASAEISQIMDTPVQDCVENLFPCLVE